MLSIVWRLALMVCLAPFFIVPIVGLLLIPVQLYLLVSMAAHVWRRINPPAPALPDNPSPATDDIGLKLR